MVVASLVAAAGVTIVIDVIAVATVNHSVVWPYEAMARLLREHAWSDTAVLAISAGVTFVGVLLVLAAVLPGKQKLQALNAADPDMVAGTTRRSLRRTLSDAALGVDGIAKAHVAIGRRRIKVTVDSSLRDPAGQRDAVAAAVTARLSRIDPARPRSVQVRLRRGAAS